MLCDSESLSLNLPYCIILGTCGNACMFLKAKKRPKDGKFHYYWSLMESVRVGRRVFQRPALYLGELNGSQHEEWQHAAEAGRRAAAIVSRISSKRRVTSEARTRKTR